MKTKIRFTQREDVDDALITLSAETYLEDRLLKQIGKLLEEIGEWYNHANNDDGRKMLRIYLSSLPTLLLRLPL